MNQINFNGETTKKKNTDKDINGIRNINIPERGYLQENRIKDVKKTGKSNGFFKKTVLVLVFLSIIAGAISYFFHSANIEVKKNSEAISFTNDIMNANNTETKEGSEVPFKLMELEVTLSKDIKSDMIEDVKEKAVGKIKITNDTSKVQKLRYETRFEVNGKIFKTYKTVTIPAKSSVIREAFADGDGDTYNLEKGLKMVIPGFKEINNMDLYKNITGEIAESFTGGFIGKKDVPDKKDLEAKKKILAEELDSTIMMKARTNLPEKFILNTDGIFKNIEYKTSNIDKKLKLTGKATVKAIIFNEKEFLSVASGLIKSKMEKYDIESTAFLKFKILDKDKISIDSLEKFTFEINGDLKYNKKFNKDEFVELVSGKTKSEFEKLKTKNYEDFTMEMSIFPFWMNSIPTDVTKITAEILE